MMHRNVLGGLAAFALTGGTLFASLIPIGPVPSTGNGIGSVNSLLTFQNTGVETGCVGFAGGVTVTGAAYCQGGIVGPTHETTGAGNNTYTATGLGITPTGANTFANMILVFNGNEGGGPGASITLEQLSLNLLSSTGTLLQGSGYDGAFTLASPYFIEAFTGIGNAGFGFQLDAVQAAQANTLLAANPDLRIGASATASGANAGFETIFISRINSVQPGGGDDPTGPNNPIPEPSTFVLMGAGLIAAGLWRRKAGSDHV